MKKFFLAAALLTSLAVAALAAWNVTREYPPSEVQLPIAQYLPTGEAQGWTYEDLPLGHTESLDAKAHEILGLTDFVYRRYTFVGGASSGPLAVGGGQRAGSRELQEGTVSNGQSAVGSNLSKNAIASMEPQPTANSLPPTETSLRPGDSFEIYIAYWAPGTMPARLMNGHTPDTCWVGSGWTIVARDDNYLLASVVGSRQLAVGSNSNSNKVSAHRQPPTANRNAQPTALRPPPSEFSPFPFLSNLPIPDLQTLPGRWRIFEKNRTELPVVFWHILEDDTYQYGHQSLGERLKRLVLDPFQNGLDTRKEQWLVRVTL